MLRLHAVSGSVLRVSTIAHALFRQGSRLYTDSYPCDQKPHWGKWTSSGPVAVAPISGRWGSKKALLRHRQGSSAYASGLPRAAAATSRNWALQKGVQALPG